MYTYSVVGSSSPRNTNRVMGDRIAALMKLLSPPYARIAEAVGVSYDTVKGWAAGRTEPSKKSKRAIAAFLRRHTRELEAAADELEEELEG